MVRTVIVIMALLTVRIHGTAEDVTQQVVQASPAPLDTRMQVVHPVPEMCAREQCAAENVVPVALQLSNPGLHAILQMEAPEDSGVQEANAAPVGPAHRVVKPRNHRIAAV